MFSIDKPEMTNKTFRMPTDLVKQMQEIAQKEDISLNYLVIQCCEYAIKNMSKKSKKK